MKVTKKIVAEKLQISACSLSNYIGAKRNPRPEIAEKIEKFTGIDKSILIFGTADEREAAWNSYVNKMERLSKLSKK